MLVTISAFQIPHRPNDKGFRALHKAASEKCMIQDISFHSCLHLKGPKDKLISTLELFLLPEDSLRSVIDGLREAKASFYQDRSAGKILGQVSFMWRYEHQEEEPENEVRELWIWSHPAYYEQIESTIIQAFSLERVKPSSDENENEVLKDVS